MDVDCFFQALKAELVPYLLKLLEGVGLENLDSPAATKAQIVKALKAMTRSLQYGEQVRLPERSTGVLLTIKCLQRPELDCQRAENLHLSHL